MFPVVTSSSALIIAVASISSSPSPWFCVGLACSHLHTSSFGSFPSFSLCCSTFSYYCSQVEQGSFKPPKKCKQQMLSLLLFLSQHQCYFPLLLSPLTPLHKHTPTPRPCSNLSIIPFPSKKKNTKQNYISLLSTSASPFSVPLIPSHLNSLYPFYHHHHYIFQMF